MASLRRNDFHSILSEGRRPDLVKSENERREIEQQVGAYIITWGFVDWALSMAVSVWARSERSGPIQEFISPQATAMKIELLASFFPTEWRNGARLIDALKRANTHRNLLAHSNLAMGGWDGEKSWGWHFWNLKGKREKRLEIDPRMMNAHIRTAKILQAAMIAILGDAFLERDADLNAVSLANAIIDAPGHWETTDDQRQFQAAAKKMFPG